jgi:hypothetical protein
MQGRVIGQQGTGYSARLHVTADDSVPLLPPGTFDVRLRCSRIFGLPDPVPDVLGLAVKVVDASGDGDDQDLLLCSSWGRPMARQIATPTSSFLSQTYSSLLPYLIRGHLILFGALTPNPPVHDGGTALAEFDVAAATGSLVIDLRIAGLISAWRTIGRLEVGDAMDEEDADQLRYNPWRAVVSRYCLPSAARSAGSTRRRTPSEGFG